MGTTPKSEKTPENKSPLQNRAERDRVLQLYFGTSKIGTFKQEFHHLKSDLAICPVFHRKPDRIQVHFVLVLWGMMALALLRCLLKQHSLDFTFETLQAKIQESHISCGDYTYPNGKSYHHKASRAILNSCACHKFGTIAIGYNPGWKQGCCLGPASNQKFFNLAFHQLINQVQYKAALLGITVVLVPEGYTSRCSFLDGEAIGRHAQYAGRRVRRGLFRSGTGPVINADVNAAYNILRQGLPEAFADGIEGVGLHPMLVGLA